MGKTSRSSSSKRKRSRYSSQVRTKKRRKDKRNKSKKPQSYRDSVSYSDDDSRSSVSVSSFSSEDSYRGRRSRSRLQKDLKSSRKKGHSPSSSSEDSHHTRKRKFSAENDDSKVRKRLHKEKKKPRKKARRDASVSSRSSSSSESEYERHVSRHDARARGRDKRKSENIRDGAKKSRHRLRSCSSCSSHDQSVDNWSEEQVTNKYTSKRLRSVITVVSEANEERQVERDGQKEEMVYDHDDYPSCKSNDSNDAGNGKEMAQLLHVATEMEIPIEDGNREDGTTKALGNGSNVAGQSPICEPGCETNEAVKESENEISRGVGCMSNGNLESILRQKALENFKRFCRGVQTSSKNNVETKDNSDTTSAKTQSGQITSLKDDFNQPQGDSLCHSQDYEQILCQKNGAHESKSADETIFPTNRVANADLGKAKMAIGSGTIKPRLVTSALKQLFSNATTSQSETPLEEKNQAKFVSGSNTVVSSTANQTAIQVVPPRGDSSSGGCPEGVKSAAEDPNCSKSQNEPQLEEKTMSVMRGGELVQVSYKVYIPKKTPALARRQLKR